MLFRRDTTVQLQAGQGIPVIRINANCAPSTYEIDLENSDLKGFTTIATPNQLNVPILIKDSNVNSEADVRGRRVFWKIGLAITNLNNAANVPFEVVVEQNGTQLGGSIHVNLNFGNTTAGIANGFITLV
jgi:hypothetical protein